MSADRQRGMSIGYSGRKAGRSPGAAADQIRADHQSQDRRGTRPSCDWDISRHSSDSASPGRVPVEHGSETPLTFFAGSRERRSFGRHASREVGQADPREIESFQPTPPPLPGLHVCSRVGEAIFVKQRADVLRRAIRKRIGGHQPADGGRPDRSPAPALTEAARRNYLSWRPDYDLAGQVLGHYPFNQASILREPSAIVSAFGIQMETSLVRVQESYPSERRRHQGDRAPAGSRYRDRSPPVAGWRQRTAFDQPAGGALLRGIRPLSRDG